MRIGIAATLVWGTATGLSLPFGLVTTVSASPSERSFSLSSDPSVVVARVESVGQRTGRGFFTLYGDGRLVQERPERDSERLKTLAETLLGPAEPHELVAIAVDAGLVECDKECIERKVLDCIGGDRLPFAFDGATTTLQLSLASYQPPGSTSAAPIEVRIRLVDPDVMGEYCPEIREIDGFRRFERRLSARLRESEGAS